MTRTILVETSGEEFKLEIPDYAKLTFGPWSPPKENKGYRDDPSASKGTLRIYGKTREEILGVFSGVISFRDLSVLDLQKKVAVEEGSTLWKSDQNGYERTEAVKRETRWEKDAPKVLPQPAKKRGRPRKS